MPLAVRGFDSLIGFFVAQATSQAVMEVVQRRSPQDLVLLRIGPRCTLIYISDKFSP